MGYGFTGNALITYGDMIHAVWGALAGFFLWMWQIFVWIQMLRFILPDRL